MHIRRSYVAMDLYLELVSLLGSGVVSRDRAKLEENSQDKWFVSHLPDVVVEPTCCQAELPALSAAIYKVRSENVGFFIRQIRQA